MKLYSGPVSMFGAKAEIAVLEKAIDCEIEHVGFSLSSMYEPKHPEVARVNPKREVPVLIDGDLELFDSTQIFEFLEDRFPEPPLWPVDVNARARARRMELESDEVFFPCVVMLMPMRRKEAGEEKVAEGIATLQAFYDRLDASLAGSDYLCSDFTYADIAFFMAQFFASFLGEPPGDARENLAAWNARMCERASVKQVAGKMAAYLESNGIPAPRI